MTKTYPIILEYSEDQHSLHYNYLDEDGNPEYPENNNSYYTVARTDTDEAMRFLTDIRFDNKNNPSLRWLKQAWTDWKKYH